MHTMGSTTVFTFCLLFVGSTHASRGLFRRAGCEDKHSMCATWASRGECVANPLYMLPNCQISCFQCTVGGGGGSTGGPTAVCADKNSQCASFAASGECHNNPAYMFDHCPKSCETCGITIVG